MADSCGMRDNRRLPAPPSVVSQRKRMTRTSVRVKMVFLLAVTSCGSAHERSPAPITADTSPVREIPICPAPELVSTPADAVFLHPGSFSDWSAVFAAHPDTLDYLLAPGDYRGWGPLLIRSRHGTATRKRTIRYYDDGAAPVHPVHRKKEALVDAIVISNASYWLIHGLTVREPSTASQIAQRASHITLDSLLIEKARQYGLRIRSASDICVQSSVVRRAPKIPHKDSVGIQIKPSGTPSSRITIVANEIYDVGDSIQITADGRDPWIAVESTFIANNDLYTTQEYARCTENGIDIKAGSDEELTRIIDNRIWGFVGTDPACANSGSRGDAVVIHRAGRNIEIARNTIGESENGVREKHWPAGWRQQHSRRVTIRANVLYQLRTAFDLAHDTLVVANTLIRSGFLCDLGNDSGYRLGGPIFRRNLLVDVEVSPPGDARPCPFHRRSNRRQKATRDLQYQRRLLTARTVHRVRGRPRTNRAD